MFKKYNFLYIFKHKLFGNSLIYTIANIINSAIPLFLLPILTRYLTPFDYGIVATFQVFLAMAIVFVGLNMGGAVSVNYFKMDKQKLKIYIGNIAFILSISFVLTFCIIYIARNYLSEFINFPKNWLLVAVIIALFQVLSTLNLTLWQVEQKPLPYGIFQVSQTVLNVSLSLIFVVVLNWGWQGRLSGLIINSVVFGLLGIFMIYKRKYINFSFNKHYIKDALFFGIPLIPASLGGWAIVSIDRLFINSMVNVATTGIYTVGYQVGTIINLLVISFNRAWTPFLFEKLKENNHDIKIKIVRFTYLYFICIIALVLALSFVAPYFLRLFVGKSFHSASKYVFWIALGYAFNGMRIMTVNYIYYVKKTYISAWVPFFCAGINVVLNYLLIKANGAIGAAQATTITFFLYFIFQWFISARVYKMPWFELKTISKKI